MEDIDYQIQVRGGEEGTSGEAFPASPPRSQGAMFPIRLQPQQRSHERIDFLVRVVERQ